MRSFPCCFALVARVFRSFDLSLELKRLSGMAGAESDGSSISVEISFGFAAAANCAERDDETESFEDLDFPLVEEDIGGVSTGSSAAGGETPTEGATTMGAGGDFDGVEGAVVGHKYWSWAARERK